MSEQRLIDANRIVEVANHAYDEWNLAMATQDTNRGVNKVFRRKELCKAVKDVAENAPTIDPEDLPIVKELREELAQVTAQRDAAIEELGGVLAMADVLTDFVDDEIYPVVSYDLYLNLRDNIDAITKWEHEEEWRVPVAENATTDTSTEEGVNQ